MLQIILWLANNAVEGMQQYDPDDLRLGGIEDVTGACIAIIHCQLDKHRAEASTAQLQVTARALADSAFSHVLRAPGSCRHAVLQLPFAAHTSPMQASAKLDKQHHAVELPMTCTTPLFAPQELLSKDGALQTVLGTFPGVPALMAWAYPCAMLARHAVQLLAGKPAQARVDAELAQQLWKELLKPAGQARCCQRRPILAGPVLTTTLSIDCAQICT